MDRIVIVNEAGLWVGHCLTPYGHTELLCGDGGDPDLQKLKLIELFLSHTPDPIAAVRRSVFSIPILWRPIRFAINNSGQLGLQFMHRLTATQKGMFFADEHSDFRTVLGDVAVSEAEQDRLEEFIAEPDGPRQVN